MLRLPGDTDKNEYMITFLLYTVFFIIGYACIIKMLHFSIQPGQWIDKYFDWQKRLRVWDEQGKETLSKWLGGCEMCTCAFTSFLILPVYVWFLKPMDFFGWWCILIIWLVWGIQTMVSLRMINWGSKTM